MCGSLCVRVHVRAFVFKLQKLQVFPSAGGRTLCQQLRQRRPTLTPFAVCLRVCPPRPQPTLRLLLPWRAAPGPALTCSKRSEKPEAKKKKPTAPAPLQIPKAVEETHGALRHPSARDEAALLFLRALPAPFAGPFGLGQAALAAAVAVRCPAVPVPTSPSPGIPRPVPGKTKLLLYC